MNEEKETNKIIEEVNEEKNDGIEPEDITREINLDDLYDGAVNNTVVIDPVSNNEILLQNKKPNYTLLGIILAILVLLALYYINNKTNLIGTTKEVKSITTTKTITTKQVTDKGVLTCTYSSKSDAETQTITYVANYNSNKVTLSNFNYVALSNTDNTTAIIDDLKVQYENFYINNAAIPGNNISFVKNATGFTFNIETNYQKDNYDTLIINDGQTVLYVKPNKDDTIESLQKSYTDKGYTCGITYDGD